MKGELMDMKDSQQWLFESESFLLAELFSECTTVSVMCRLLLLLLLYCKY